jgi:hypothetical protein
MTLKPARTTLEREVKEERFRYLKREQEEQEARKSLRDFLRHRREEEEEYNDKSAPNTF